MALRALIIGAGVIGATTAYCLRREGYHVTVVDSASSAGVGASNVNAGLLVPGDSTIWPHPGAPKQVLEAILHPRRGALRIHARVLPSLVPWGGRFMTACLPGNSRKYTIASLALSRYGYAELHAILEAESIEIHHRQNGMVFLAGTQEALEKCFMAHSVLEALGEAYRILTPAELVDLDPGYAHASAHIAGALYAPSCGSGDCGSFTRQLVQRLAREGVDFRFGTRVQELRRERGKLSGVKTSTGVIEGDLVILAAGAGSPKVVKEVLRLPVLSARGYSVTIPLSDARRAPTIGGVDDRSHVAFSRLGDRLRATSTAEIGRGARGPVESDYRDIRATIEALFPGTCDWTSAHYDMGDRPMMPTDVPAIGPTSIEGLYLNTGHGHLGWTQSCGSARLLADLIKGRQPQIDAQPYLPAR